MWGHGGTTARLRGESATDALRPWPHVAKMPAPLVGTELLDADHPGQDRVGVVWHRRTGLMSATALLGSSRGLLIEPAVAEAWVACWWSLLRDACAHPEVRAATVTVDATRRAESSPVRLTLTIDPGAIWQTVSSVGEAAAVTVRVLDEIDVGAVGVVLLRWASAADLARTARAAFEPHCRWLAPEAEPPAWGELAPGSELERPQIYRHERYASTSWALHLPPRERPEAIPALLAPGRYARRVTLVQRDTPRDPGCSLYVTATVPFPGNIADAKAEVEALHPGLAPSGSRQARAFAVGLPVGWFR